MAVVIQGTDNELIKVYDEASSGSPIQDYIVADGTGIEKGTLLKVADPRTASKSSGATDYIAGIAVREKIASDGRTRLSVYKKGYFRAIASGAITCGQALVSAGVNNMIKALTLAANASGAAILGYADETAADQEAFILRLDL